MKILNYGIVIIHLFAVCKLNAQLIVNYEGNAVIADDTFNPNATTNGLALKVNGRTNIDARLDVSGDIHGDNISGNYLNGYTLRCVNIESIFEQPFNFMSKARFNDELRAIENAVLEKDLSVSGTSSLTDVSLSGDLSTTGVIHSNYIRPNTGNYIYFNGTPILANGLSINPWSQVSGGININGTYSGNADLFTYNGAYFNCANGNVGINTPPPPLRLV